jgi:hypothetical protein
LISADGSAPDSVFINCPFDDAYLPLFEAQIFTIYACQFRPRSAREIDDGSQMRMEKIYQLIEDCRYGVHDLSRTELAPETGLPRFNMPLELGVFLGAKRFGDDRQRLKRALLLDREPFRYQRFISDLAGLDIHSHANDPEVAITKLRDWLANVTRRHLPGAPHLVATHRRFRQDLPEIAAELGFGDHPIPYVDFERIAAQWLANAPAP